MALAFSTRNVAARPQAAPRSASRQLRLPVRAAAAASADVPGQWAALRAGLHRHHQWVAADTQWFLPRRHEQA